MTASNRDDPLLSRPLPLLVIGAGTFLFTAVATSDSISKTPQVVMASAGVALWMVGAVLAFYRYTKVPRVYRAILLALFLCIGVCLMVDIINKFISDKPSISRDVEVSLVVDKIEGHEVFARILIGNKSSSVLTIGGFEATTFDDWVRHPAPRNIAPGTKIQLSLTPDFLTYNDRVTVKFAYGFNRGPPEKNIARAVFSVPTSDIVGVPILPTECCESDQTLETFVQEDDTRALLANDFGQLEMTLSEKKPNGSFHDFGIAVPDKSSYSDLVTA